ncbi:transposase [Streptomyces nitrosporeus]|uniref:Transposase n=1 Tax=Streptomyces nitrosporeus TaxID=28894 RepID=A0A5J6FHX3_9ACTN|nr:transposase [Streptomyces nitrosporeus]QEU75556.1 transposase [Streptomyces nitrosporeus]GGZ29646.1 putative ISXo8 transposase [Streptomyces nitrosporeus]
MPDTPSLRRLARPARPARPHPAAPADTVTDLCAALFAGFCGYDQRVLARQYMDGLLRAEGRKSIANIAASAGVPGDEQRLHHFVSSSRWAVGPVRRALAAFLCGNAPVSAWVALPVSIPKTGRHMVGVSPHFSVEEGHRIVGQRAYGVWYASEQMIAPVGWRLGLPGSGSGSGSGRELPREAGVPGARDCVTDLLDDVCAWQGHPRLFVTDARGDDEQERVARLFGRTSPLAVRISGHTLLAVDTRRPGAGRHERLAPAHSALDRARRTRSGCPGRGRESPLSTATARVRLPGPPDAGRPGPADGLALVGVWNELRGDPAELWLTNAGAPSPSSLLRAARLARAVGAGWRTRGRQAGLRDYEGRSLRGWHRHMTLASCAYAMAELRSAGSSGGSSLVA